MSKLQITAFAGLIAVAGAAHATQYVVLDSKGSISKTLPQGSVVDDSTLDVPDHDWLVLMNSNGDSFRVEGPHKGPVAAPGKSDPGMLERLSEVMKEKPATFGATRGGFLPPATAVPAAISGTACIFEGSDVQLVWKEPLEAVKVSITDETSKQQASFDWPVKVGFVNWPSTLPATDGDRYTVTIGSDSYSITLKKVGKAATPGATALAAVSAGCSYQAHKLAEAVKPIKAP
jgi:hypothetical protein